MQLLDNRAARAKYEVVETLQAGLVLTGGEVKMLRGRHGSLVGSHVRIMGGDGTAPLRAVWLNGQIPPYPYARNEDYDIKRSRPLLLSKAELAYLKVKQDTKGLAIIPMAVSLRNRRLKLDIAVARGKKLHDRRRELRERDLLREAARDLKR